MAKNFKLLTSGYKSLNLFLRPHSTFKSTFLGGANLAKANNSILFNAPQRITLNAAQLGQLRSAATVASANHWNVERYLSVALLAIIPAGIVLENNVFDHLLAVSLVLHSHWGLQQILTDYLHGPTLPKLGFAALYVVSALALAGLIYFNYSDIGISKAVKKIWSL